MTAPVNASRKNLRAAILSLAPFLVSKVKTRINKPPIKPRDAEISAEERGRFLLKIPIDPKTIIDEIIIINDFGSFFLLFKSNAPQIPVCRSIITAKY